MRKKAILTLVLCALSILLIVFLIPFPIKHRIEAVAYAYTSESIPHNLSLDFCELNYLFKTDEVRGNISLYSQRDTVLDHVKFASSLYRVGPLETLGDVTWISFLYYDADMNAYTSAGIYISNEQQIMIEVRKNDAIYVAPAENQEEADLVLEYFARYIGE